jgi:ATP-dependent RNA helicase DOB1
MESLFAAKAKLDEYKSALRKIVHTPQRLLPFLNIGRIIRLVDGSVDWGYGISLNFHKKDQQKKNRN